MKKSKKLIFAFAIVFAIILVWGLIGSSQASNIGTTCDFGIGKDGSALCWKWHKNIIGNVGDSLQELFN